MAVLQPTSQPRGMVKKERTRKNHPSEHIKRSWQLVSDNEKQELVRFRRILAAITSGVVLSPINIELGLAASLLLALTPEILQQVQELREKRDRADDNKKESDDGDTLLRTEQERILDISTSD